jgi:hypothetical protein
VIDFSVAEWPQLNLSDVIPCDLGPIEWTITPPAFVWADRQSLKSVPGCSTRDLAKAWYSGWSDPKPRSMRQLVDDVRRAVYTQAVDRHLDHCCTHYALRERE